MKKAVSGVTLSLVIAISMMVIFAFSSTTASLPVRNFDTGKEYATIQEAIDDPETEDGHLIEVSPGIYTESVFVNKNLTIRGTDVDTTIIEPPTIMDSGIWGNASNLGINGFTIRNTLYAVSLLHCDGYVIRDIRVVNSSIGIDADYSDDGQIDNVNLTNINLYGVGLTRSSRFKVEDVQIVNGPEGIILNLCSNGTIERSAVTNITSIGIGIWGSHRVNLTGNSIKHSGYWGYPVLYLSQSHHLILRGNQLWDNFYGLRFDDPNIPDLFHDIDITNTIDGKQIHYLVNKTNEVVEGEDVGYVGLVNCANITVRSINTTRNHRGLLLANTTSSKIESSYFVKNYYGISLLLNSSNNLIHRNVVRRNRFGLQCGSSGSRIYHNSFLENNYSVTFDPYLPNASITNDWDNGYPSGGNYWSDQYHGPGADMYKGPGQNISGNDGIVDSPYNVSEIDVDHYPFLSSDLKLRTEQFNVIWKNKTYVIDIFAPNSTIKSFNFDNSTGRFTFNITSHQRAALNITIPKTLLDGAFNVMVDYNPTAIIFTWTNEDTYIYFNTEQGNHTITIVGEHLYGTQNKWPQLSEFPDLNGDGIVNMRDVGLAAKYFGTKLEDL